MLRADLKTPTKRPKINDAQFIESIATEVKYHKLIESRTSLSKQQIEQLLSRVFQELFERPLDAVRFVCILYKYGIPVDEKFYNELGERPWAPFVPHYQCLLSMWIETNKSILRFEHPIGSSIEVLDYDGPRLGIIESYNERTLCYRVKYTDLALDQVDLTRRALTVSADVPVELVTNESF